MTRIVAAIGKQFGPAGGGSATPAPTLAVSDNADGTGGVATITGAAAGAAVTVYSQAVDGDLGSAAWTSRGSRTGNGTVSVAPGNGFFWWKAIASAGGSEATSNLVYQNCSDGLAAVHHRCLAAVQSKVRALGLAGLDADSVLVRKLPIDRGLGPQVSLPAVLVTPERETMPPGAGVNLRDDVGYAVAVTLVDRDNQEPSLSANLNQYLRWREQIARAFRHQRLPGVPEIVTCTVEPAGVVGADAWAKNLYVSSLVLRFTSREQRGI